MKHCPSWQTSSHWACQEIPCLLWNPSVHYCMKNIIWDSLTTNNQKKQNRHYCVNICFYSFLVVSLHVSTLFLGHDAWLCNCPKLYLFVNNTQQDAYHKGLLLCSQQPATGRQCERLSPAHVLMPSTLRIHFLTLPSVPW
jgi:hypothetical protein